MLNQVIHFFFWTIACNAAETNLNDLVILPKNRPTSSISTPNTRDWFRLRAGLSWSTLNSAQIGLQGHFGENFECGVMVYNGLSLIPSYGVRIPIDRRQNSVRLAIGLWVSPSDWQNALGSIVDFGNRSLPTAVVSANFDPIHFQFAVSSQKDIQLFMSVFAF